MSNHHHHHRRGATINKYYWQERSATRKKSPYSVHSSNTRTLRRQEWTTTTTKSKKKSVSNKTTTNDEQMKTTLTFNNNHKFRNNLGSQNDTRNREPYALILICFALRSVFSVSFSSRSHHFCCVWWYLHAVDSNFNRVHAPDGRHHEPRHRYIRIHSSLWSRVTIFMVKCDACWYSCTLHLPYEVFSCFDFDIEIGNKSDKCTTWYMGKV